MIWGIPLVGDRIAPRCTCADELLLVSVSRGRVASQVRVKVEIRSPLELGGMLARHSVDALVCGGVGADARDVIEAHDVSVVDNVACSSAEAVAALDAGVLCPGYGFAGHPPSVSPAGAGRDPLGGGERRRVDCLACEDRVCLSGLDCLGESAPPAPTLHHEQERWLEAAIDVVREEERQLCRVAEVVYFCLEMKLRRIGLAFCVELLDPCRTLAGVLSRFFEVVPVCCRVGGSPSGDTGLPCNPARQAQVLNEAAVDLNVAAGLCIGADCVFNRVSAAPVTTLFVKDKSLAHNPIGAVYSDRYLRESMWTPLRERGPGARGLAEHRSAGSAHLDEERES